MGQTQVAVHCTRLGACLLCLPGLKPGGSKSEDCVGFVVPGRSGRGAKALDNAKMPARPQHIQTQPCSRVRTSRASVHVDKGRVLTCSRKPSRETRKLSTMFPQVTRGSRYKSANTSDVSLQQRKHPGTGLKHQDTASSGASFAPSAPVDSM